MRRIVLGMIVLAVCGMMVAPMGMAGKPQQPQPPAEPTGYLDITTNPQLVLTTGSYVRQYDWVDGAFQHTWSGDGITKTVIGDVDNDGAKEIVSEKSIVTKVDKKTTITKYYLRIWEDGDYSNSPSINYEIGHQMGTMAIGNVDDDEYNELVISCVDAYGSAEVWSVTDDGLSKKATISNLGWSDLAVADADNDGIAEILMGQGTGNYFQQPVVADYDIYSGKYSITPLPMGTKCSMGQLSIGNVDVNQGKEIFGSGANYLSIWRHTTNGYVQVWQKQLTLDVDTMYCSCANNAIADIDGDGYNEISFTDYRIIGTTGRNVATTKLVIYKYDVNSISWYQFASYNNAKGNLGGRMLSIDLDDDDESELIVCSQIWDWSSSAMVMIQELPLINNLMGTNSIA
jgi:hypothetical protein